MENEEGSWWSRVCRGKKPPKTATTGTAASSPDKVPAEENAKVDLDGLLRRKNNTLVDSKTIARTLLQGMGSGGKVAAGLLVVANILERFEDVRTNQIECLDLLKEMLKLGKLVKEFKELKGDTHNEIEAATALIVEGSMMCCAHINSPEFSQFSRAGINKENINQIKKEVDTMYRDLQTKMLINLRRKLDDQPGHLGKKPPTTATTGTAASSPDKIPAEENAKVDLDGLLRHITKLFQMREGRIAAYEPGAGQQFWPSSQRFINLNTFLYDGGKANKNNTLVDSKTIASIMLQGMGSGSMVAAGLLVVANILERFEDVSTNQIECLDLLKEMLKLGKLVKEFQELKGDTHNEIEAATALIVEGSIMCCAHINSPKFSQFFRAGINKKNIDQIKKELDTMYRDLHIKMLINLQRKLDDQPGHPGYFPASQPPQQQAPAPVIIYAQNVFLPAGGLLPTGAQEHEEQDKRKADEEAKRAEEKRKAGEEAKRAEEKRKAGEEAKRAEEKRKAGEEAKRAEEKRGRT